MLEDGEPADPAVFVTPTPDWHEGDVFVSRGGQRFRILAIEPAMDADARVTRLGLAAARPKTACA